MSLSSRELPPNIKRWMSPEDQNRYGHFVHPRNEVVPPPKTDKLERDEQRQFANWCHLNSYPVVWHATNARTKSTPGTPDFILAVNRVTLWLEFKRDYSCQLSTDQEEFARLLKAQGVHLP